MADLKISFSEEDCKGCALCVEACPKGLIRLGEKINKLGYHPAGLENPDRCTGCGLCAVMCPDVVITLERGAA